MNTPLLFILASLGMVYIAWRLTKKALPLDIPKPLALEEHSDDENAFDIDLDKVIDVAPEQETNA